MADTKSSVIKFRLTDEQKALIESYCRKHNISISEFAREACTKIFSTTGTQATD